MVQRRHGITDATVTLTDMGMRLKAQRSRGA